MAMYLGNQAVKIIERSKNLIPFPYEDSLQNGDTFNGVTYTINEDGTVILNGTSTGSKFFSLKRELPLVEGKDYTVSGAYGTNDANRWRVYIECYTAEKKHLGNFLSMNGATTFTAPTGIAYCDAYIFAGNATTFNNQVFKPMLNEGKPAPYGKKDSIIPFRIRSGVNKGRNPKNLIPFPYEGVGLQVQNGGTWNGVTYTIADDGTVTLNGTSTAESWFRLNLNVPMTEGKTYTISGSYGSKGNSYWRVMIELYTSEKKFLQSYASLDGAYTFTANAGTSYGNLYVYVDKGHTYNNQVFKPMLNEGTKALPYYYYD